MTSWGSSTVAGVAVAARVELVVAAAVVVVDEVAVVAVVVTLTPGPGNLR